MNEKTFVLNMKRKKMKEKKKDKRKKKRRDINYQKQNELLHAQRRFTFS